MLLFHLPPQFDEDSGLISDAFIEAVAAIVLQTAIRRFLAMRRTQRLREEKKVSSHSKRPPWAKDSEHSTGKSGARNPQEGMHHAQHMSHPKAPPEEKSHTYRTDDTPVDFETRMQQQAEKLKALVGKASATADSTLSKSKPQQKVSPRQPAASEEFQDMEERMHHLAAIQIQSSFRGWWVRDSINVDHFCATLIQTAFRRWHTRMEYHYDLFRITVVQSVWRQKMVYRRVRFLQFLIIRIQAAARGYLARRRIGHLGSFPSDDLAYSHSQDSRKTTKERLASHQHSWKGHRDRRAVAAIAAGRKSTSQRQWKADSNSREYSQTKHYSPRRHPQQQQQQQLRTPASDLEARIHNVAATIIQSAWLGYINRMGYLQTYADILIIQHMARRWLERQRRKAHTRRPYHSTYRKNHVTHGKMMQGKGTKFEKVGSFESSKHTASFVSKSLDESEPSVPFRVLTDDDPVEQPPSLSPPRKSKSEEQAIKYNSASPQGVNGNRIDHQGASNEQYSGYYSSPPRDHSFLSSQHPTPNGSDGDYGVVERVDDTTRLLSHLAYMKGSHSDYESSAYQFDMQRGGPQLELNRNVGLNDSEKAINGEEISRRHSDNQDWFRKKGIVNLPSRSGGGGGASRTPEEEQNAMHQEQEMTRPNTRSSNYEQSRNVGHYTAGWNAEEEIEKEATRNLIAQWKQKDKKNSFKIGSS